MARETRSVRLVFLGAMLAASLGFIALQAFAAGMLENPGFETGDFSAWTVKQPVTGNTAVVRGETIAAMGGRVVKPQTGEYMARLGQVRDQNNHQVKGITSISQTFVPQEGKIHAAFRIFSWEHRGRDAFIVRLTRQDGTNVSQLGESIVITLPDGRLWYGGSLPYRVDLDIDTFDPNINKKKGWDSGWLEVFINDIPLNEGPLTLTYELNTASDAACDSWVYVDLWNSPPEAKFQVDPRDAHEGDVVALYGGLSTDPDGIEDIVAWDWEVTWDGSGNAIPETTEYTEGANPYFYPPDDGDYYVKLTVTDSEGASDTTETVVSPNNYPALTNALDVEVMPGRPSPLVGRFLDQGWLDSHEAVWDAPGASSAEVLEDNLGCMTSGIVTGMIAGDEAPGEAFESYLHVTDDEMLSQTDTFTVNYVEPDPDRHEPNNALQDVGPDQQLEGDGIYLSYLQSKGDMDLFEVVLPDGDPLEYGTEVLVTLRDLPADFDLVMLSLLPAQPDNELYQSAPFSRSPFSRSPFSRSPFSRSPFSRSPFSRSPFSHSPFSRSAYDDSPFSHSPFSRSPFSRSPFSHSELENVPFSRSPYTMTPFSRSPFSRSPFSRSEIVRSPFSHSPFSHSPFSRSPFSRSPFSRSPFSRSPLDGYPFSEMSYTGLSGDKAGGGDISVSELGLDPADLGELSIAGFSAELGVKDEILLVPTEFIQERLFIAVVGSNGAFSDKPYTVQIETSRPPALFEWANMDAVHDPLVENPTTEPAMLYAPVSDPPKTLFVTQRERLMAKFGMTDADWTAFEARMEDLAERPEVGGHIMSVSGDEYFQWDTTPEDVSAANAVAQAVRGEVWDYLAQNRSIECVLIVGDDDVVPFRRVKDETVISNERYYAESSFLYYDSPLMASMYGGYNLTDDYLVDESPIAYRGRALYIPDLAIGRLVETPEEMLGCIDAYEAGGGVISPTTAAISGHDFFEDGARAVVGVLPDDVQVDALLGETWTGDDLRSKFLAQSNDLNSINAHFMHFAGLAANGYNESVATGSLDLNELLLGQQVAEAGGPTPPLKRKLTYSIGCHAGLNVPDDDVFPIDESLDIDPSLDLPQAVARQGGMLIGSTGYGLGDTEGLAGTEALMVMLTEEVSSGDVSVGDALREAKLRYLTGLSTVTEYDEKSSIQYTLYGLPFYRMETSGGSSADISGSGSFASAAFSLSSSVPYGQFELTVIDGATTTTTLHSLELWTTDSGAGQFITADGDAQASADRPVQPRVVVPLTSLTADPVHGYTVLDGSYSDIDDFDPVNARLTHEWEVDPQESQLALDGWWPESPVVVNTVESYGETTQELVVVPAQFQATSGDAPVVTGTERLFDSLVVQIVRSADPDWIAPTIKETTLSMVDPDTLRVTVAATDANGIASILVNGSAGGTLFSSTPVLPQNPHAGSYHVDVDIPAGTNPADVAIRVQVADPAGNTASSSAKGASYSLISVDAGADFSLSAGGSAVHTATVTSFAGLAPPVTYSLDFGDGRYDSASLVGDTLALEYTYPNAGVYSARLTVSDSLGRTGSDTVVVSVAPSGPMSTVFVSPAGSDTTGDGTAGNPYATIGRGLIEVTDGGTVAAYGGTYNENVTLRPTVSLLGITGSANTTIQAPVGPVVQFPPGVGSDTTLWGFTITGVNTPVSGVAAVYVEDSSPNIVANVITGNIAYEGGGILSVGSAASPIITDNEILDNEATTGAGIEVLGGSPNITRNRIIGNEIPFGGGSGAGILAVGTDALIEVNTIEGNRNYANPGGGLFLQNFNGVVRNNSVANNYARTGGGGLYLLSSNASDASLITSNTIESNSATLIGGGVVVRERGTSLITNNTIVGNWLTATSGNAKGGGIHVMDVATPIIQGNLIDSNDARYGGGVSLAGRDAALVDNVITNNAAAVQGGGVYMLSAGRIEGGRISLNEAGMEGGGVYGASASLSPFYVGTEVTRNTATYAGGGLFFDTAQAIVEGSTITSNTTSVSSGGGISATSGSGVAVTDCVLSSNMAATNGGGIDCDEGSHVTVSSSTLSGNEALNCGGGIALENSVVDIAPQTYIEDNTAVTGGGVYSLNATASAQGSVSISDNTATDSGGGIYTSGGTLDLAPDPFGMSVLVGNTAGTTGGGIAAFSNSWVAIGRSLFQSNTALAGPGGAIYSRTSSLWVEDATLRLNTAHNGGAICSTDPLADFEPDLVVHNCFFQTNTATVGNGGSIYGVNLEKTSVSNSRFEGGSAAGVGGNVYFAVMPTLRLDRVQMTGGQATNGGAAYCSNIPALELVEPIITLNSASQNGGGLYAADCTDVLVATPLIEDCDAVNGGGVHFVDCDGVRIDDGTISSNSAAQYGGGVCAEGSSVRIAGSLVDANTAGWGGGGAAVRSGGNLEVVESDLIGNDAYNGGGIDAYESTSIVSSSTITQNTSTFSGAGLYSWMGTATVDASSITSNTAGYSGNGGGLAIYRGPVTLTRTDIGGNSAGYRAGGAYFELATGELHDCTVEGNEVGSIVPPGFGEQHGGGLFFNLSEMQVIDSVVRGNTADNRGGGLMSLQSTLSIHDNFIMGNSASLDAGGIQSYSSTMTVVNNVISDNVGHGILAVYPNSAAVVVNNTIVNNTGAGVYADSSVVANLNMFNCIVYGNGNDLADALFGSLVAYCDIGDEAPAGTNISADPNFVSSGWPYDLAYPSPCVNVGAMSYGGVVAPGVDIRGVLRPWGTPPNWDMGAYEYTLSPPENLKIIP